MYACIGQQEDLRCNISADNFSYKRFNKIQKFMHFVNVSSLSDIQKRLNQYWLYQMIHFFQVIVTCLPFTLMVFVLDSWPFGLLLCKLSEFAKDVSVGVSVFTLTALSADRFFAIVDPMRKLHATGKLIYCSFNLQISITLFF